MMYDDKNNPFVDEGGSQPAYNVENNNNKNLPTFTTNETKEYRLSKGDFYFPGESSGSDWVPPVTQQYTTSGVSVAVQQNNPTSTPFPRVVLFIVAIIGALSALSIFILTCMQFSNHTETALGSKIYVINDKDKEPCSAVLHRPLRFRFDGDTEYIYCSWTTKAQLPRFFITLFTVVVVVVGCYSVAKSKKWLMWLFSSTSLLLAITYFILMCVDANFVRISSGWCNSGMEGMTFNKDTKWECNYTPYIITCVIDFVASLIWGAITITFIKFIKKYFP